MLLVRFVVLLFGCGMCVVVSLCCCVGVCLCVSVCV